MTPLDHFLYALLWLSFGLGHSILASASVKGALSSQLGPSYRLGYNIFAVLHLAALFWVGREFLSSGAVGFDLSPSFIIGLDSVRGIGVLIIVAAVLHYDLGRFGGLSQIRAARKGSAEQDEPFRTHGMLRYVRHPIYTGAHLFLWASVRDEFSAATAFWASLYLIIGAKYEERRLVRLYGDQYRDYQARVPSIIPWKGLGV